MKGRVFGLFLHLPKTLPISYLLKSSSENQPKWCTKPSEPYINVSLLKARSIAQDQHYIVSLKQIEIVIEQRSYADVKC